MAENTTAHVSAGKMLRELGAARSAAQVLGFLGIAGLIAGVVAGGAAGDEFPLRYVLQSYVFGFVAWLSLALGCLGLLLLHHVIRATWTLAMLRILEAGAKTLPTVLFLSLPLLASVWFGDAMGFHLYHWTDANAVAADKVLQHKALYLNPTFFTIRWALYFALWIGYTKFLVKNTALQDRTADPVRAQQMAQLRTDWSAPGIVLYMISVTFATTDWIMSLDPHWLSTIYGVWWAVSSGLAAIALSTFIIVRYINERPYAGVITPKVTRDFGNIMLCFTMLWAYMTISQFLIYWSGNLPEYNVFYTRRFEGPLVLLGGFLVVAQFLGPFLVLLSVRTKRTPALLLTVAGWVLVMRFIDAFWQVVPYFGRGFELGANLLDLAALAGVGGVWMHVFLTELRKHPLLPAHDTRLQDAAMEAH